MGAQGKDVRCLHLACVVVNMFPLRISKESFLIHTCIAALFVLAMQRYLQLKCKMVVDAAVEIRLLSRALVN
jgi:hypothetical protein